MTKTCRKLLPTLILLLSIAGGSLAVYCSFFIYSNPVHVDIQYNVVLTYSVVDSDVTLSAAVTNNGNPVRAGIPVNFYYSIDSGPDTYFATQLTDSGGVAQTMYAATTNGGYDFKAEVAVP